MLPHHNDVVYQTLLIMMSFDSRDMLPRGWLLHFSFSLFYYDNDSFIFATLTDFYANPFLVKESKNVQRQMIKDIGDICCMLTVQLQNAINSIARKMTLFLQPGMAF